MILPPRPRNHRPLDRSRRTLDLPVTVDPPPPQNRPHLDRVTRASLESSVPRVARDRRTPGRRPLRHPTRRSISSIWLSCSPPISACGSKAHRPDLMLKIALCEIQTGHHSPGQWATDTMQILTAFIPLGLGSSLCSRWCTCRDRVGPLLDDLHRQILGQRSVAQGLTTVQPFGSLATVTG